MRSIQYIFLVLIFLLPTLLSAQEYGTSRQNRFFISWGWNGAAYTKSDIHFKGADYDFTLSHVKSHDRQTQLGWKYVDPTEATKPQYNFRVGVFLNPKYSISFGFDHMKYVVLNNQTVDIDGFITSSETEFDGVYEHQPIKLTENFLLFEHTNGLNYLNMELRRQDRLLSYYDNHLEINSVAGVGSGILYPKSDVTLIDFDRNDQWHLAGYGTAVLFGLNVTFLKCIFIQGELKGGFINMPDILTTASYGDRAKQHFFFLQRNINIGYNIRF